MEVADSDRKNDDLGKMFYPSMLSKFLKMIVSVHCVKIDKAFEITLMYSKLLLRTPNENQMPIFSIK